MRTNGIKLLSLCFAFLTLTACASLRYKKIENPHFWLAQKGDRQVYVFGTFHAYVNIHEIPPFILHDLEQSQVLVLEVPPIEETRKSMANFLARLDRGIVQSTLNPEDWKFYQSLYSKSSLGQRFLKGGHRADLDNFSLGIVIVRSFIADETQRAIRQANRGEIKVKPEFISEVNRISLSLDEEAALDKNLYEKAIRHDLVLDFLDRDIETLIEIEQEISEVQFSKSLEVAKSIARNRPEALLYYHKKLVQLSRLAATYRSGQPVPFDQYLDETLGEELRLKILQKRNQAWVRHFQNVETGYNKIFLAVGAAHLYGEGSFLQELQELGYSLKRLSSAPKP